MSTTGALLRFHLATGARLAMRAAVPLAAVFVAVVGMNAEPEALLRALAARLAADPADPGVALGVLALAIGLAGWASRRVTLALSGWILHLPASRSAHERAAALAIGVVLTPLLTLVATLMIAGWMQGAPIRAARLAGLPLLGLATASLTLPGKRRVLASAAALAAAVCALAGSWVLVLAGVLLLAPAAAPGARAPLRSRPRVGWKESTGPLAWTIARRAVGLAPFERALPSLAILGACALFLRNNELTRGQAALGVRLAGGLAVAAMLAGCADLLAVRRPVWPWARSLPWSAARRVLFDAAFIALATLPLLALLAGLDAGSTLCVLAAVPLFALRAVSATRRDPGESAVTPSAAFLVEGSILSAWLALVPWLAPVYALVALPALRRAARREQTFAVSRFRALRHDATGDPLSWEGR